MEVVLLSLLAAICKLHLLRSHVYVYFILQGSVTTLTDWGGWYRMFLLSGCHLGDDASSCSYMLLVAI